MGNILGEKFDNYVQNQITVRQESLGKYTNISTKDLLYYQNKTPWLRLASSVDLEVIGRDSNLEKLSRLLEGIDSNDLKDSNLAKKCVLHGGIVDESKPQLQSGLRSSDNIFSGAYGWGGGERGFVPQPGIVGADVTYYNNGALSKCTVNIKCFSREQFAIIDALYMRPGYTVLLEFGWSLYLSKDKNNNIELNSFDQFQSSAFRNFLNGKVKDNFDIYKLIESDRKTYEGNYNGVYGKISKFDWSFNNDGSYDITIQITGMGDIIESLTIPSSISDKQETKERENIVSESKLKSKFHNELEEYRKLISTGMLPYSIDPINALYSSIPSSSTTLTINNFNKENNSITIPYALYQISGGKRDNSNSIFREDYISFGALIATIQNLFLLYNKDQSIYGFDMNFDNLSKDDNFIIRLPLQFSSDPTKVLIPVDEEFNIPLSSGVSTSLQLLEDKLPTKIASSLNSNYLVYNNEITEKEKTQGKKQLNTDYFMLLSSVYINMNYVEELLNTYNDPTKNEIELLGVIKDILTSINSCTGNINNLDIKLDNDVGLYRFKNSTPFMLNLLPPENTSKFNLFGFLPKNNQGETSTPIQGSFIRDISLTSGITDEWATLISIGAASNSSTNFTDSTSFKLYNKGLKDRILPERDDKVTPKFPKNDLQKNLKKSLKEMEEYYELVYDFQSFNESTISTLKSKYSTTSGYLKEYYLNKLNANISFFLPFNLKLTMDGIGGIKLYQRFEMDERILPPMYDDKQIDLIVNGINHSITPAGWTTTLDSLSVPKSTAQ